MCFPDVSVQRFGRCQSVQMIDPRLLRILPFAAREQDAFFPFQVSVAWQEAVWWRFLPRQMGQAGSLSCRLGPVAGDRKEDFLPASGDRERRW